MKELKPCPICGGMDLKKEVCIFGIGIRCKKCGGPVELFPDEETARKEWNRKKRKGRNQ